MISFETVRLKYLAMQVFTVSLCEIAPKAFAKSPKARTRRGGSEEIFLSKLPSVSLALSSHHSLAQKKGYLANFSQYFCFNSLLFTRVLESNDSLLEQRISSQIPIYDNVYMFTTSSLRYESWITTKTVYTRKKTKAASVFTFLLPPNSDHACDDSLGRLQ